MDKKTQIVINRIYEEINRIEKEIYTLHCQYGVSTFNAPLPDGFVKSYIPLLIQREALQRTHYQISHTGLMGKFMEELSKIRQELSDIRQEFHNARLERK